MKSFFFLNDCCQTWENTPKSIREKIERDTTESDIKSEQNLLKNPIHLPLLTCGICGDAFSIEPQLVEHIRRTHEKESSVIITSDKIIGHVSKSKEKPYNQAIAELQD